MVQVHFGRGGVNRAGGPQKGEGPEGVTCSMACPEGGLLKEIKTPSEMLMVERG